MDLDALLGKKNTTCWVGYKVHLTETCDEDLPNLITHVETTAVPTADGDVTPRVHRTLQAQDLLPSLHIVDTGFLDAELQYAQEYAKRAGIEGNDLTRSPAVWSMTLTLRQSAQQRSQEP